MSDRRSFAPHRSNGITIGRVAGIPITVHVSWSVSFSLLTWVSHDVLVSASRTDGALQWLWASLLTIALTACIVVHELAHSLIARASGLPVGGITLFAFGGVSQIEREAPTPAAEFRLAIAGPLASVLIAACLAFAARLQGAPLSLEGVLGTVALFNAMIALFNLMPAFPMDGGRVLRSILWALARSRARATRWAVLAGRVFALALVAMGPAVLLAAAFGGGQGGAGGLYSMAVGLFLFRASGAAGEAEGRDVPNEGNADASDTESL